MNLSKHERKNINQEESVTIANIDYCVYIIPVTLYFYGCDKLTSQPSFLFYLSCKEKRSHIRNLKNCTDNFTLHYKDKTQYMYYLY